MKKSKFTEAQIVFALHPGRDGNQGWGGVPEDGDQRCHLLQLEEEVWGLGTLRCNPLLKIQVKK